MSFTLFLTEGMIKLPPKLLKDCIHFFVYWYIAQLKGKLDIMDLDSDDLLIVTASLKQILRKFDVETPSVSDILRVKKLTTIKTKFTIKDFPKEYLNRLIKLKGIKAAEELKNVAIFFELVFSNKKIHKLIVGETIFDDAHIKLYLQNMKITPDEAINLLLSADTSELSRRINNVIGVIEHEITHIVQHFILQKFNHKQIQGAGLKKNNDDYVSSNIEFDPFLKTSIRAVNNIFAKKGATTIDAKKKILEKFTFSDKEVVTKSGTPKQIKITSDTSFYFKALKRTDKEKWKKAVKLLYKEVLGEA